MEALSLHTGAPKVNCKDNTSYISVVEYKIFTPRVNHIGIPILFLQFVFENGILIVSCRKICEPKHVQVQLSVGLINV